MKKRPFGRTADGRAVEQVVLESADAAVSILSLGAIVRDWRIDGLAGSLPMVLGFPTVEDYVHHARSHGAICGRVANRVRDARSSGRARAPASWPTKGPHQLHGGPGGLGTGLGDGHRQRRRHGRAALREPGRRPGLAGRGRLHGELPPRGAAAGLRDARRARTGRRRSTSPTTTTTTWAAGR